MKKRIIRLVTVLTIMTIVVQSNGGITSLYKNPSVEAIGDLTVNWGVSEGSSIFIVNNIAPGQSESKNFTVQNNATEPRPVGIRVDSVLLTEELSQGLSVVIKHGSTDVYGGSSSTGAKTLQDFYADSVGALGASLSTLNSGASATYTIVVSLPTTVGNEYQGKEARFDLHVGVFYNLPAECSNITFSNVIYGTEGDDNIVGTNNNDLIIGFEGNDTLDGAENHDCLLGGSGDDILRGGNYDDIIKGDSGNDTMYGGNGTDSMYGGSGDDSIYGETGSDSLYGGLGLDLLFGGNGSDYLDGGTGTNTLDGGNAKDECINGTFISCEL